MRLVRDWDGLYAAVNRAGCCAGSCSRHDMVVKKLGSSDTVRRRSVMDEDEDESPGWLFAMVGEQVWAQTRTHSRGRGGADGGCVLVCLVFSLVCF